MHRDTARVRKIEECQGRYQINKIEVQKKAGAEKGRKRERELEKHRNEKRGRRTEQKEREKGERKHIRKLRRAEFGDYDFTSTKNLKKSEKKYPGNIASQKVSIS